MSDINFDNLPTASGIDGAADYFPINTASPHQTARINRQTFMGVAGQPADISSSQNLTNKTLNNTNTVTLKDTLFTLQDDGDTTKQAKFQLSGITTATTRTYTLPNASSTLVDLSTTQTLSNKTLPSPVITGGSIDNSTVTVDTISGHTVAGNGTVYGLDIHSGVLQTANAITTTNITNASVTPDKLSNSPKAALVATAETTTSTSYTDLATTTDTVTVSIGANGLALVILSATQSNSIAGDASFTSFAASGANTIAASDARALGVGAVAGLPTGQSSWSYLATGLTPGSTVFKMKYRVVTGGTVTYSNRYIVVIPF